MDAAQLVQTAVGDMGPYQIWLTTWIYLHRMPVIWHQLMVILAAPPAVFTCSDASLDKCDEKCPSHVFDRSIFEDTIVMKWDLVCKRETISSMIQSTIMVGILIGNVSFGIAADRFGRKIPLVLGIILQLLSGLAAAFAPDMFTYTILRVISTIATGGTMMTTFAILMEFTAAKYRTIIGVLFTFPVHIGQALMGPVGYFLRRWDHVQIALSSFSAILILYWCVLPESPRWLIAMGRTEKAIATLEFGAKFNKMPTENIRPNVEAHINLANANTAKKSGGNVIDLFRTSKMRTKTIVLFIDWFLLSLLFYAIGQYIGRIGGDIFLNIFLGGMFQCPGNILCCILISRIGRKWTLIGSFLIVSVPMFVITFIPPDPHWPVTVCACISMCGAAMTFALIYVYTAELLPTSLRTTGMGLSSMFARFGSMISPFIMQLRAFGDWLPPLVFAVLPVISILFTLFYLPETNGRQLPDTVEEADQL